VVDRSGSMSGPPLAEALRCAGFVVDGLRPDDRVAVISYDNEVATDWPLSHPEDKRPFIGPLRAFTSAV
jgi:Ca-activated chloride channel homolog